MIRIGDAPVTIEWSQKMTKTKHKFEKNTLKLSSKLLRHEDLETIISNLLNNPSILIDGNKKIWIMDRLIGKGGYSLIYSCQNVSNAIIKLNSVKEELIAYTNLNQKCNGIPKFLGYGYRNDSLFLILEKFKLDLNKLIKTYTLPLNLLTSIISDVIDSIEQIHNNGFVHCDIKPHNIFLTDSKLPCKAILGDLGLTKPCSNDSTIDETFKRCGTLSYMSTDVHSKIKPSMRSDLESFGWVLLEMYGFTLPWKSTLNSKSVFLQKQKYKENIPDEIPICLKNYMSYVHKLEHTQKPDYNFLKSIFVI